ncbi:hypothetical protein [Amycolatopsis pithecellobii]|nr:hypothetical protein [Amycolatopsis pithecellobii]
MGEGTWGGRGTDMVATEHADATITDFDLSVPGHPPWWRNPT